LKVVISSRSFGKINSGSIDVVKDAGFEVVVNPHNKKLGEDELIELIHDADGLIAGTEEITEKVLKEAKMLKVISRYGVGLDNVDIKAAEKYGIKVYNTPNAPSKAVAELTLGLIFDLKRKISKSNLRATDGKWNPQLGTSLFGNIVGIVGLGRIGKEVIKLLEPFGVSVLAYEINPDNDFVKSHEISLTTLENIFLQSDVILLHLPLTEATRNIVGQRELSLMKNTAILVNTARGGLIDEDSLIRALEAESIEGVALDVFDQEPYRGRLLDFDRALLTPHIGSYTKETRMTMEMESVENVIIALKEVSKK
jgi:D-3-phosphoglycerate dehydrogenase